jgi:hypothetical protein
MPTELALRALGLAAAMALVVALFYMGSQPAAAGLIPPPWDKVVHAAYFAAIAALLWIGMGGRRPWAVIAIAAAVGGADELHQAYLPGREADWLDFATDAGAAALAIALLSYARRSQPRVAS